MSLQTILELGAALLAMAAILALAFGVMVSVTEDNYLD